MRKTKVTTVSQETGNEPNAESSQRATWIKAGAAVGIGSAAIVAALLYSRRQAKKK